MKFDGHEFHTNIKGALLQADTLVITEYSFTQMIKEIAPRVIDFGILNLGSIGILSVSIIGDDLLVEKYYKKVRVQ